MAQFQAKDAKVIEMDTSVPHKRNTTHVVNPLDAHQAAQAAENTSNVPMSSLDSLEYGSPASDDRRPSKIGKACFVWTSVSTVFCVVAVIVLFATNGADNNSINIAGGVNQDGGVYCGDGLVVPAKNSCDDLVQCNCPIPEDQTCSSAGDDVYVVKDVKNLTLREKRVIVDGVHKMKTVPSTYDSTLSAWDYFVVTHLKATRPDSEVHAGWYFYPWHREMMTRFTSELRRVTGDPKIFFPYWNWADTDSSEAMFGLDYMGPRAGLQQQQYVVKEGNFREGKWVISEPFRFLYEEKQFGSLVRAPGNGVQMCFDENKASYVLDTPNNHQDIDHRAVVGPFHFLGAVGAPPASVFLDTDVYMQPRDTNLVACGGMNDWSKLGCDRYYDAIPQSNLSRTVKTLRCQHYATTMPTDKDYERCSKLPKYSTQDPSKLGRINMNDVWATTKDYSNSASEFWRACFEGIDPSDPLAKGLERVGASLHPPHGATHTYSGGSLATPVSPNDPLFTGLHWNVERKFAEWQKEYGSAWFTDGPMKDMLDKNMPVFENPTVTLRSVLDHKKMGYTFDTLC